MIRALFQNFWWKMLSLAVAVALWVAFIRSPELEVTVSAPLEFQNMPADLELSTGAPERILLQVTGLSARLHELEQWHSGVVVDLANVRRPGEYTYTMDQQKVALPYGLHLARTIPGQVRLHFERRLEAEVPVRVRFAGSIPQGYRIAKEEVQPPMAKIAGAESRVRQVTYVETDPVDLSRVVDTGHFRVHVFLPDPQVRLRSAPVVEVGITLQKSH